MNLRSGSDVICFHKLLERCRLSAVQSLIMNLQQLRVYIFISILFFASFFGSIFLGSICVVAYAFKPTWYRSLYDFAIGFWEWLAAGLLEKLLRVEIIVSGDIIDPREQSLIIMNHRTCFDWMYFWNVLIRQSKVRNEKIILKSSLKKVPGAGWAMQGGGFMFLERKWETDEAYLDTILSYFKSLNYKSQILLFPEGTDFNESTKRKSELYAEANGLPVYSHVLHPRTTGFVYIADTLRKAWTDANVYDVTVSYDATPPQSEWQLLAGILPNKVFFHIKRHPIRDLPTEKEGLVAWCHQIWSDKEERLKKFYSLQNHPQNTRPDSFLFHLAVYGVISFWLLFILLSFYACCRSNCVFAFVVVASCFYIYATKRGGLELLTAKCRTHILR